MRYMVAVDESETATWAFFTAVQLARDPADELFVMNVIDDVRLHGSLGGEVLQQVQRDVKAHGISLVKHFIRLAHTEGIQKTRVHGVVGTSPHAGEMLCQAVEKKGIDILVIGRRGMGALKRFVMGSTSKYCVEHADCDVLVIKHRLSPTEEHASKELVVQEEEAERAQRMRQGQPGIPPASYIAIKAAEALQHRSAASEAYEPDTDSAAVIHHMELDRDHPEMIGLPVGVAEKAE